MADALNKFSRIDLTTVLSAVYTAPATSVVSVLSCLFGNKAASATTVDVQVIRTGGGTTTYLLKGAPVPVGSALDIVSNKPIVLSAGDAIWARANDGSTIDVTGSVFEQIP